jgi:hypothetical protein
MILLLFAGGAAAKTVNVETIELQPSKNAVAPTPVPGGLTLPEVPGSDTPLEIERTVPEQTAETATDRPEVLYDISNLPKPVARMHAQMMEAALSGDINRMRIILESNEVMPTLSFGEIEDPIDFLKESSGDGEGYEILAILADTLDAGFVHVDAGTPQEMYIWPYFARYPLHELTPDEKVELFRIVTSADFAEMEQFGAWTFYRVGIGPDGTLHYFVAGD